MNAKPRNIQGVNSSFAEEQENPAVAIDANGFFSVAWGVDSGDPTDKDVFVRFFAPGGKAVAPSYRANTTLEGDQENPSIATGNTRVLDSINGNSTSDVVVVWQAKNQGDAGNGIFAQRFQLTSFLNQSNGQGNSSQSNAVTFSPINSEFRVSTSTEGNQEDPVVAMNEAGNFVVVWAGRGQNDNNLTRQDGSGFGIFAQRYNANGTPIAPGVTFDSTMTDSDSVDVNPVVPRTVLVNSTTRGDQEKPAVAIDARGNFVVVWQGRSSKGDGEDIYAQLFDRLGNPRGLEFRVNSETDNDQVNPAVAMDKRGNFVIAWEDDEQDDDGTGISARRYSASGNPNGNVFRVNQRTSGDQRTPAIGMDKNGSFTIAWSGDDDDFDIFEQQFEANGNRIDDERRVNSRTNDDQTNPAIAVRRSTTPVSGYGSVSNNNNYAVIAWQNETGNDDDTNILARRYTASQSSNSQNGNTQNGTVRSTKVQNRITGSAPANHLLGSSRQDLLVGQAGDDILQGKAGADKLRGGSGDDRLNGGLGDDVLVGGLGKDLFEIGRNKGTDTIQAFERQHDRLSLLGDLQYRHLSFVESGKDTLIQAGNQTIAVVEGIGASKLQSCFV